MSAKSTVACFNSPQPEAGAGALAAGAGCTGAGSTADRLKGVPHPPQNLAAGVQSKPQFAHLYVSARPQFSQKRFESGFAV
jgi:hypothetical protein